MIRQLKAPLSGKMGRTLGGQIGKPVNIDSRSVGLMRGEELFSTLVSVEPWLLFPSENIEYPYKFVMVADKSKTINIDNTLNTFHTSIAM